MKALKRTRWILMGLAIAFMHVSGIAYAEESTSPEEFYSQFRKAMASAKSFSDVKPYLSSEIAEIWTDPSHSMDALFPMLQKVVTAPDYHFTDVKVEGENAVLAREAPDNGKMVRTKVDLKKEDGTWKFVNETFVTDTKAEAGGGPSPEEFYSRFREAMITAKSFNDVKEYIIPEFVKQWTESNPSLGQAIFPAMQKLVAAPDYRITNVKVEGGMAVLTREFSNQGKVVRTEVILNKEGNAWKFANETVQH